MLHSKNHSHHIHNPDHVIITCSDARLDPLKILSFKAGDAFIIRTISGFVPPVNTKEGLSVWAPLAYALFHLNVKNVILMAHTDCGGLGCLHESLSDPSFLPKSSDPLYCTHAWVAQMSKDIKSGSNFLEGNDLMNPVLSLSAQNIQAYTQQHNLGVSIQKCAFNINDQTVVAF
jgi:carbonic anhydrase